MSSAGISWALCRKHLLYDTRRKMTVVSEKLDGEGLLGLLKKADKTFECIRENGYRAANAGQFMVDLVIAPRGMHASESVTFSQADLVATEVPGLPDREPLKKPRDMEQAQSVAKLVIADMPHLPFEHTLTSLHGDVRKMLPVLVSSHPVW